MVDIIGHRQWLAATDGGRLSVRSRELKALDAAIERYGKTPGPSREDAVRTALINWISSKRGKWRGSIRNRSGAIKKLLEQLGMLDNSPTAVLRGAPGEDLRVLFANKRLEWKPGFKRKLGNNKWGAAANTLGLATNSIILVSHYHDDMLDNLAGVSLHGINAEAAVLKAAVKLVAKVFKEVVPVELRAEVGLSLAAEMPALLGNFVNSMVPFLSEVTTGGATVLNLVKAGLKNRRINAMRHHSEHSMSEREPRQAIEAMIRTLRRERNAELASGAVSGVAFGAQLAGLALDGGAASRATIGCASNVIKLANILRMVTRDVREKNAANRLMQRGVDITIFEISPIVGAYYVCCASSSDLINVIFSRFGEDRWQDTAEAVLAQHIEPLRAEARELISMHRFHIPGLEKFPGMISGRNSAELARMARMKGNTGMAGFGSDSLPAQSAAN
ncbi:hypothetical protein FKG94_26370 [Exilibacterium tricleocarpae]|uniref:Uncharacterized protein n=1 Tax=Exilibacterium tricleocarpae TaxID=2591008 RepID=A0A545SQ47_9GAMM|nr:hypothetical protein [Exilibacterium tricleocarpae]TQV66996.1 hypothetical protein FKG94_26370 [Exilibacterium tricleocarpae]